MVLVLAAIYVVVGGYSRLKTYNKTIEAISIMAIVKIYNAYQYMAFKSSSGFTFGSITS